jgi:hypothetical protein
MCPCPLRSTTIGRRPTLAKLETSTAAAESASEFRRDLLIEVALGRFHETGEATFDFRSRSKSDFAARSLAWTA